MNYYNTSTRCTDFQSVFGIFPFNIGEGCMISQDNIEHYCAYNMPHVQRITAESTYFCRWLEYLLLVCVFWLSYSRSARPWNARVPWSKFLKPTWIQVSGRNCLLLFFKYSTTLPQHDRIALPLRVAQESTHYTTGKYSSIAFVWVAIAMLKLKSWNHIQHSKQYEEIVLTEGFHLNGYTLGFHPDSTVPPCTA